MASRIPPLLEPYLGLPPETSLIVLTSVLGVSTNWLVQRYLSSWLVTSDRRAPVQGNGVEEGTAKDKISVVLVSFLRDYSFWKEGAGRVGVDLDALSKKGRFVFIDGLSGLFSPASSGHGVKPAAPGNVPGKRVLSGSSLPQFRKELEGAVTDVLRIPDSTVVLILDNPDLVLAASGNGVYGEGLRETLLDIREKVHSTIVTLAADEPLISAQATSLENKHAAFSLSLAHEADMIISLRMLDTGTAKDVSGVLRVTHGGGTTGALTEEQELLYFVGGDGGVRVFERGQ